MSNIDQVIALVKATPNYDKAQMVEQIVAKLKVTKANAQVYLYNANKKLGNPTSTKSKKVTLAKVSTSADIKAKNLDTMKSVSRAKKREIEDAEREVARQEALQSIDDYMENDVKPYIDSLTKPARKAFQLAE